jgi:C1A family cysteine protease
MKGIQLFKSIIGLLVLLTIVSCSVDVKRAILDTFKNAPKKEMFKVFHFLFEKKYELNSEEAIKRYKIFKSNMKIIEETNAKNLKYKFGVNQFTDLTPEEFKRKYLMDAKMKKGMLTETIKNLRSEEGSPDYFDLNADREDEKVEESIDFGAFTPVDWRKLFLAPRDQGACGSCWTFATTAAVEAAYALKSNVKEYLSTQQMVDCDTANYGCNGGNYTPAVNYVKLKGLMRDVDYPYKAIKSKCRYTTTKPNKKIISYNYCSNYSTKSCTTNFVYGLLAKGPLMVGVDGTVIQYYESGIFTEACEEDNHAVVLVG